MEASGKEYKFFGQASTKLRLSGSFLLQVVIFVLVIAKYNEKDSLVSNFLKKNTGNVYKLKVWTLFDCAILFFCLSALGQLK